MQADEYNYQSDEQFTDQAWGEMHKILNKEMPVQKKKRRRLFWLFFFLGLGIAVSGWWFTTNNSSTPSDTNSTKWSVTAMPSVKATTSENKAIVTATEHEATASSTTENKVNQASEVNKNRTSKVALPLIPTNNNNSTQLPSTPTEIKTTSPSSAIGKAKVIAPVEQKSTSNTTSKPLASDLNIENIDAPFFLLMEKKDAILAIDQPTTNTELDEEKMVEPPKANDRKIELGLHAGILLDFVNLNEVGAFAGLHVHFPIQQKFGIRTGLGVSALPKDLDYRFVGEQVAAVNADLSLAGGTLESIPVQSRTDFVLETMYRVELPLLVTYQPHQKIQVQLGGGVSYLLDEILTSQVNELSIDPTFASNNSGVGLNVADLSSVSRNQYQEEDYWNRWDVSAIAGFTWKPFRRWQVELQYHHGFLDILKTNSDGVLSSARGSLGNFEVYNDPQFNSQVSSTLNGATQRNYLNRNRSLRLSVGFNF
ncbi:MAG: outer membrane beta-barrel protein [Bacteroidota bacterium]